eukprot:5291171-Amphidinium_carterae.2
MKQMIEWATGVRITDKKTSDSACVNLKKRTFEALALCYSQRTLRLAELQIVDGSVDWTTQGIF